MKLIIDRFEGNFAVAELENQQFVSLPRQAIPSQAKEGDVLSVEIDHAETQKRAETIKKLMDQVWED
ncbi:MAG: DUF3006 domain-containing protein [Oscillospiraceae bacterium]|nr:DUF3006 domain-containing protein [Oscillospiraceae bacterium]